MEVVAVSSVQISSANRAPQKGFTSQRRTTGLKRLVVKANHIPPAPTSEPDQPPTSDHMLELLEEETHEEAVACLNRLGESDTEVRKRALRAVRDVATERPRSVEEFTSPLSTFPSDENRAVRQTTAKLFVALAQSEPAVVLPVVDVLAERLADEEDFYLRPGTVWRGTQLRRSRFTCGGHRPGDAGRPPYRAGVRRTRS